MSRTEKELARVLAKLDQKDRQEILEKLLVKEKEAKA